MTLKKSIIIMMLITIIISFPIKSNAICNTIQTVGEVAAVRLTLSDGRVLHNANVSKDYSTITEEEAQTSVKSTNIIFIVDTSHGMEKELDSVKNALKNFSDDIYNNVPYSYIKERLKISFIGFDYRIEEDEEDEEDDFWGFGRNNNDEQKEEKKKIDPMTDQIKWTASSDDCNEQIDALTIDESGISLEDACNLAQNNLFRFGMSNMNNETMTQYIVVISNGLDDLKRIEKPKYNWNSFFGLGRNETEQEKEYTYDTDEEQIQRASTILSSLSKDEMVLIQGISIKYEEEKEEKEENEENEDGQNEEEEVEKKQEENLEKLYQYISESGGITANNWLEESNEIEGILKDKISKDIKKRSVNIRTIKPYTDLKDGAVTPDTIMLFADNELMQGATLEIEYLFETNVWLYSGSVYAIVQDFVGHNLSYEDDHRLLTDPSKKNSDFQWTIADSNQEEYQYRLVSRFDQTGAGVIDGGEKRLVVSTLITTDTFENDGYTNISRVTSYRTDEEGKSEVATKVNEAMKVVIIPPTGEDRRFETYWYWIVLSFILVVSAIFFVIKGKINKENMQEEKKARRE